MSSGSDLPDFVVLDDDGPGSKYDLDEVVEWLDRTLESRKPIDGPPVLILSEVDS